MQIEKINEGIAINAVDRDPKVPPGYNPALYKIRHSLAHVMAQAVRDYYSDAGLGPVKFAIGPPIENGFYYDFDLPRPLTAADLPAIEERMRSIIGGRHSFITRELSAEDACNLFADQPYKLELIEGLVGERITVYTQDAFTDLCRGPHVDDTSQIDPRAFKLLGVSGAYWRGNEHGPALQRIYGTAWPSAEELAEHVASLAEAERRDHRRLGKELELFHLDPTAPGMPYWLPRGLKLMNELVGFWRREHEQHGYLEVDTPILNSKRLWEISGHWEHYKDNMFLAPVDENNIYLAKPMNCPNAMIVYNLKTRSYRDLPLRLADCGTLHRLERSGALHGLLRVQKFHQDDAHIFVREDQIEEEFDRILALAARFYEIFGLKYRYRFGTRPEDFLGDVETWDRAEASLTRILDKHIGSSGYVISEGDGAFYGPKIDILIEDVLRREWQLGTLQLDFQLPRRFGCRYVDAGGSEQTPVVIHRAIYGSLERFIGILIEHTGGAFPVWLAPVQVRVVPISEKHNDYACKVGSRLDLANIRVEYDIDDKRMQAKVRRAELDKVPYIVVVGDREAEDDTVSVRIRSGTSIGSMTVDSLAELVKTAIDSKTGNP